MTSFPELNAALVRLASAIKRPKLIAAMLTYGILIVTVLVVIGRLVARHLSRDACVGKRRTSSGSRSVIM